MTTFSTTFTLALGGALLAGAAGAQPPAVRERPLGPIVHASKELLGAVSAVRGLPDGGLLVNDITGRKVVRFDSTLAAFTVVADTTSATGNAYSSRAGGLIPWRGDSTLFVDPNSLSMLVIDGAGKVTPRVLSVPRANEAFLLVGGPNGTPGTDPQGRLLFRGMQDMRMMMARVMGQSTKSDSPSAADSAPLLRMDLATRKLDTLGTLRIPKQNVSVTRDDNGRVTVSVTLNPMPVVDDWAVLADGSVAVLRGQDYHIDWIRPDGQRASTPKIPFDWKRMSDDDKVAFIDSARVAAEKLRAAALSGNMAAAQAGAAAVMGGGGMQMRMEVRGDGPPPPPRGGSGDAKGAPAGDRAGGPGGVGNVNMPPINMVAPSDLPDYAPPFTAGSSRGDLDGHLWVRTSKVVNGGSVYDVIDGTGALVDRVRVPAGRVIAGFGRGVVYMGVRDGAGVRLEIARMK